MDRLINLTLMRKADQLGIPFTETDETLMFDAPYSKAKQLVRFCKDNHISVEWCKVHALVILHF